VGGYFPGCDDAGIGSGVVCKCVCGVLVSVSVCARVCVFQM